MKLDFLPLQAVLVCGFYLEMPSKWLCHWLSEGKAANDRLTASSQCPINNSSRGVSGFLPNKFSKIIERKLVEMAALLGVVAISHTKLLQKSQGIGNP
ncbi:MAG: hypothetical protein WBG32_09490 [Nodosilinea sp.]